ncbi:MAG: HDOD domain-containing protein [Deltaproteobacteria bacterium]|nr:HDOD domain-containing protein [Deltaproteobacteria bacterium]MBW2121826.1 HDOD domain-containing protein [Deltaproteobacteria bacterium]
MEPYEIIHAIAEMTENLQPIPQVAARVMEMMGDADTSCKELSSVISKDPGLTSRILSLSNAPYYRRMESITSLNMAVMILGFGTIQSLVLTIAVGLIFGRTTARGSLAQIWEHSVAAALVSELLAKRLGLREQETYYIAGLLHDVGKFVFCQRFPEKFREGLKMARTEGIPFFESERIQFGFDHAQLGQAVLRKWHLPEIYHAPVAHHHRTDSLRRGETPTLVVHVADNMAHEILQSEGDGEWKPEAVALERLGVGEADIHEMASKDKGMILENLELIVKS